MAAPFPNIYTHRKVAETASKACDICYKPSSSVLITPNKKDFFYICPAHLKDRNFASPKIDEEAVKAKREKELEEEKANLMTEYEERQKKKKEKEKAKEKEKEKDKDGKDKDKDKQDEKKKDDDENKDKDKSKEGEDSETPPEEEPRIFELKTVFYQQRLQKKKQGEAAKRDRERVSQPGYFPSVPTDLPSK